MQFSEHGEDKADIARTTNPVVHNALEMPNRVKSEVIAQTNKTVAFAAETENQSKNAKLRKQKTKLLRSVNVSRADFRWFR